MVEQLKQMKSCISCIHNLLKYNYKIHFSQSCGMKSLSVLDEVLSDTLSSYFSHLTGLISEDEHLLKSCQVSLL